MKKLNFKDIANSIKSTQPGGQINDTQPKSADPPKEKIKNLKKTKTPISSIFNRLLNKKNKKDDAVTESVTTEKAKAKIDILAKSKIDLLSLSGILPTVAILEVKKLRERPEEIYINANSKKKLVNVLILDDELITNTILDKTIEHSARNVKYGLFVQRIATNLREFGREGSLFNLNHPLTFNYGTENQQILLLANVQTINTLKKDFNIADPDPLKFKIGHLYIPDDKDGSLDTWLDPKSKPYTIDELPQALKNSSDSTYHTEDMDLFDFDPTEDEELKAILSNL